MSIFSSLDVHKQALKFLLKEGYPKLEIELTDEIPIVTIMDKRYKHLEKLFPNTIDELMTLDLSDVLINYTSEMNDKCALVAFPDEEVRGAA